MDGVRFISFEIFVFACAYPTPNGDAKAKPSATVDIVLCFSPSRKIVRSFAGRAARVSVSACSQKFRDDL